MTRRQILTTAATAALAQSAAPIPNLEDNAVKQHDLGVENLLKIQITDPGSPYSGSWLDATGLPTAGSSAAVSDTFTAAFLHPKSKFHKNPLMLERMKIGIDYAVRNSSPDGNISLLFTNFNSPPDTAFAVWGAGNAALLAKKHQAREIIQILDPFLKNARKALVKGGVHTPNHRWVVSSALAMLNEFEPDPQLVRRIDQWLAEQIDIDEDGQFDERSIIGYNVIVDRSLLYLAKRLNRPQLFEPLRKNLDSAFFLMHPGDEMVTEISHRQDRNTRGNIGVYWFPMHYMAVHDQNPRYAWVARKYQKNAALSMLMAFPEMLKPMPEPQEPSADYHHEFKALDITRIRRQHKSATIMHRDDSRFLILRSGDAVLPAIRFSSAFFGKGQFVPKDWKKVGSSYVLTQKLEGPYYQPFDPPRHIHAGEWGKTRPQRKRTEICHLEQSATITETATGFRVRIQSHGTDNVPVAIEIATRDQALVKDNLKPAPLAKEAFILSSGQARVSAGGHQIRFGPGLEKHQYTQVRGAESKADGDCVYITGFTPFDHTLEFECL